MLPRKALFSTMQASSTRFDSLLKIFQGFCACFIEAIGHKDCPVKGLSVESGLSDANYFDVLFVGERWRFILSTMTDGNGISSGVVNLYRMPSAPESQVFKVCSFTFNGRGDSDVIPPDNDGDPIPLDTNLGALYLVLNCIHQGLSP